MPGHSGKQVDDLVADERGVDVHHHQSGGATMKPVGLHRYVDLAVGSHRGGAEAAAQMGQRHDCDSARPDAAGCKHDARRFSDDVDKEGVGGPRSFQLPAVIFEITRSVTEITTIAYY